MNDASTDKAVAIINPQSWAEMKALAEYVSDSELIPKDFRGKPANALIAIQMGREVGLSWANALQSIAVINGRPSIWGDAALALVMAHPQFEAIDENECSDQAGVCVLKRRGMPARRYEFTVEMARQAGLLQKDTYKQHLGRMLQRRSRARAMADLFPDALKGLALADDAQVIDVTPDRVNESKQAADPAAPKSGVEAVKAKLKPAPEKAAPEKPTDKPPHIGPELKAVLDGYAKAQTPAAVTGIDNLAAKSLVDHEKPIARDARKARIAELVNMDTGEVKDASEAR